VSSDADYRPDELTLRSLMHEDGGDELVAWEPWHQVTMDIRTAKLRAESADSWARTAAGYEQAARDRLPRAVELAQAEHARHLKSLEQARERQNRARAALAALEAQLEQLLDPT
jgi:hypothetical protein